MPLPLTSIRETIRHNKGFSLIEVLMVITILAILFTLAVPSYSYLTDRAAFAGCVSRLKILHVGLNNYMQDHDMVWPQLPQGPVTEFATDNDEWEWWYNKLKDYDVARHHWHCPGDDINTEKSKDQNSSDVDEFQSSYVPTTFDEYPNTAFRWKQPWVIERGGFHYKKQGPNMLMPDGSVIQGPGISAP
jgi:prepilin-type N-terminal cleavage/methylation domain-containing protein